MKMISKKKQTKIQLWSIIIGFSMALILAFCFRSERDKLLKTGVETVGIVTHTYVTGTKTPSFVVIFSFIKDDSIIDVSNTIDIRNTIPDGNAGDNLFQYAIVGNTYKVRYFHDKPLKKARIFMDEPVVVSIEDYSKLLVRVYEKQERVEKSKTWWKNW